MKKIGITWYGPYLAKVDDDDNTCKLPDVPNNRLDNPGFYCIYGRHPVYGPGSLLYIGATKANETSSRNFRKRLPEHFRGRFFSHIEITVFLGICDKAIDNDACRMVESILIAAHMPALNRQHIDGATPDSRKIYVQNFGSVGALTCECSGSYWAKQ